MPDKPQPSRLVRLSSGALLLAAAQTRKKLQAAVDQTTEDAKRARNLTLAEIVLLSRHMTDRAREAILSGRQHARSEGARRLVAELAAVGIAFTPWSVQRHDEDSPYAVTAAESLSIAWRSAAMVALAKPDATKAVANTAAMMRGRIERTASTETARSFSDEHRRALVEAADRDDRLARELRGSRVMREWSAMLEACPRCWSHDGERAAYDADFSSGDMPGAIHPRCMCTETVVAEAMEQAA